MKREIIRNKFRDILVCQLNIHYEDVTDEADLVFDLGADSLDIVEIIMRVEDEFNIEISDREKETLRTVKDYLDIIDDKKL